MMEQTNLNIGTIGQKLQNARQARDETISQAAQATRILPKIVKAMESDHFEEISAPVYARGFLKLYASYLGLNPLPLLEEYNQQYSHTPRPKPLLTKDVEHNLSILDNEQATGDSNGTGTSREPRDVYKTAFRFGGSQKALKKIWVFVAIGVVVGIVVGVVGISRRSKTEEHVPIQEAVEFIPREPLFTESPDVYLLEPGKVDVKLKE